MPGKNGAGVRSLGLLLGYCVGKMSSRRTVHKPVPVTCTAVAAGWVVRMCSQSPVVTILPLLFACAVAASHKLVMAVQKLQRLPSDLQAEGALASLRLIAEVGTGWFGWCWLTWQYLDMYPACRRCSVCTLWCARWPSWQCASDSAHQSVAHAQDGRLRTIF